MEFPDYHSSTLTYRSRFQGEVGAWLLDVQNSRLSKLLDTAFKGESNLKALDIGGGHGQLTKTLQEYGFAVTTLISSPKADETFKALNLQSDIVVSPLTTLPFTDTFFDLSISFRIVPHLDGAIMPFFDEACRVSKRAIIFDIPLKRELPFLGNLFFSLKKWFEGNTRPYETFTCSQISALLKERGFQVIATQRQFAWPMVIHRALKSKYCSILLEQIAKSLSITQILGSPAIVLAIRTSPSIPS